MRYCTDTEKLRFINECEEEFYKQVRSCAELVFQRKGVKYIALSGPTCSGKTTTAEILIIELKRLGLETSVISIDHFFRRRKDILEEAKKNGAPPDLDSVKAIDLELLKDFIRDLEDGREAHLPYYDFELGEQNGGETVIPNENTIFIFEGIQAFYPEVIELFESDKLIKLFISVERELVSEGGTLTAREQRLLRRILRDSKFRGTSPFDTLRHWDEVAKNERLHIDPYKNLADAMIDSTVPYGCFVMRDELIPLISDLPESPKKEHLLSVLKSLEGFDPGLVPDGSVIREFIG